MMKLSLRLFKDKAVAICYVSAAVALCLLSGCGQQEGLSFHTYCSIAPEGWQNQDTLDFELCIRDSAVCYALTVEMRNRAEYPYLNLPLSIAFVDSVGTLLACDSIQLLLADGQGSWRGKGWGGLYCSAKEAKPICVPYSGRYTLRLSYALPDSLLPGLSDIGIRLESLDKKTIK